eukprot:Hpha_TRINITY_DN4725_c0_g1::TRINITY_DN4725_c0_g1_i1::g.130595::m.130595/K02183/CALM; calmodulin
MDLLDHTTIEKARAVFEAVETRNRGVVPVTELGGMLKSMGAQFAAASTPEAAVAAVDPQGTERVELPDWIMHISRVVCTAAAPQLRSGFSVFEKPVKNPKGGWKLHPGSVTGKINSATFRFALTQLGVDKDRLSDAEASALPLEDREELDWQAMLDDSCQFSDKDKLRRCVLELE